MDQLDANITVIEKYDPINFIGGPSEASRYMDRLVEHSMRTRGMDKADATNHERHAIYVYSMRLSDEVRDRVRALFNCRYEDLYPTAAP